MAGKKIPFSINQNDARPLFNQVVDGFREAIISGYYAPGEKIPSSRDLCQILGVSRIVTQAALRHMGYGNGQLVRFQFRGGIDHVPQQQRHDSEVRLSRFSLEAYP